MINAADAAINQTPRWVKTRKGKL